MGVRVATRSDGDIGRLLPTMGSDEDVTITTLAMTIAADATLVHG